ncbi:MAG TPA: malto-oligosyltrehalose synthase, partial [Candidatus Binataceae bacterium]|nr:malto-oligosyltrehalose synthase [Candidatus Binataceae bacterium]
EDPMVFADTHELVLRWLADNALDGVRVDHIDGLRDPESYLRRLRDRAPAAWIVVEKILEPGEPTRSSWPVEGTTGYDFLNRIAGLFVDPAAEEPLTRLYVEFTGESADFDAIAREKKDLVMREVLGSDLNRLTAMFLDICEKHPRYRDYSRHDLHETLKAAVARLPVYRTYVRDSNGLLDSLDEDYIRDALSAARRDRPDLDPELFDLLADILTLRIEGSLEVELAMRFQQFTGPVMAKAVEDTAFYCFQRFVCLNEVGGDPSRFGGSIDEFHRACAQTQRQWPLTLLATSTHDTKRSEDVRARLFTLSEIPARWAEAVRRWARMNDPHWRGRPADRNAEYLLYQTLVGAWPIEIERVIRYMEKAIREAKRRTSWTNPNADYEAAVLDFTGAVLADREFTADLAAFVEPIVEPGRINSLAQTLLKLAAPGVPDFYQGSELWHFALVDPDNRGPVDYAVRRRLLRDLDEGSPETVMRRAAEGLPKLWLIRQALALRRSHPQAFGPNGTFSPIVPTGSCSRHAIAFRRGDTVIAIAPRLVIALSGDWRDTAIEIPRGEWVNALTGDRIHGGRPVTLSSLMERFPVCLLSREDVR